jgi:hypothetical protein
MNFPGAQFTTNFTFITSTKVQTLTAEALRAGSHACSGTQFTCITSTTAQILTRRGGVAPGPLPIIRTGPTSSLTMVAEAKALGCEGVLISYLNGVNENADELVKACISLALEVLSLLA